MAVRTDARVITFGRSPEADIRATEVSSAWPNRLTLRVAYAKEEQLVRTRLVGEHWVTSILAAIACGVVCGIKLKSCAEILDRFNPIFGRYSVHTRPDGEVYVLDSRKAPYWTVAAGLAFVKSARAPRKTIIVGTMSDYPGSSSPKYRQVAREALDIADRVIFVGPNSGHVSKLRQEQPVERLFVFQSTYQASSFIAENVIPNELIYIKASISDHLERIMLSRIDQVVCWRERCKIKEVQCSRCRNFYRPHAAPFGLLGTTH
jgi:UDP-N-acetylmuramoyl-tripeptide--D-alanyl-D-alanine ligase